MPDNAKTVTLSTGEVVTFKPYFTHRAERAYNEELRKNIVSERAEDGSLKIKEIPLDNFDRAWEATLQWVVSSIEKGGVTKSYSEQWVNELHPLDYDLLSRAAMSLRDESQTKIEEGKKKD